MDSPVKGLTSSSTTTHKPLVIPKSSASGGGNNENELNLDQLDSKLPTAKKPSAKHFMSPTISAANKTAVPRKKILGERNEVASTFADTHLPKTPNLDSRTSPMRTSFGRSNRSPRVSYSSASEPDDDDDDDHTTFVVDSSLKPYDPLTNYLSPRPKFLRYKPNRLHQIFLHKENETGKGIHSSADDDVKRSVSFDSHQAVTEEESSGEDARSSSLSSSQDGSVKVEDERIDKIEGDPSGEDARSSSLSSSQDGSVKVEDERIDKIEGDHDGDDEIRKGKYEFGVKESVSSDSQKDVAEEESAAADARSSSGSSSLEVPPKEETEKIGNSECHHDDDEEEEEEIEEFTEKRGWNLKGFLKFVLVLGALFLSTLYISSMNSATPSSPTLEAMQGGFKDGNQGFQNVTFEDAILKNFEGGSGPFDRRGETQLVGVDQRNIDKWIDEVGEMQIPDNMGLLESTDELGEVAELKSGASDDGCEHENQLQLSDHEFESKGEGTDQLLGAGFTESEGTSDQEMETTREDSDQLQEIETAEKSESFQDYQNALMSEWLEEIKAVEEITTEGTGKEMEHEIERAEDVNSNAVNEIVMSESIDNEENEESATTSSTEIDSMEAIIKQGKIDSIPKPVIGVSMFLTILAYLGFVYYSRNRKTSLENSLSTGKPLSESVKAEKISPVLVNVEEKNESIVNPSSMICSREEAPKEIRRQSHAPMVELLGELVIGEASSSLRSCGVKSKMIGESEESNVSVSQEKSRSRIKAQALLSQLEFSTADSPSYGSFTSEKKIVKKEESRDGEVNMLITTTPVRRSSRLRSRSVMSP